MLSLCIYFGASTALYCGADALANYGVPYKISRISENLSKNGCTRCLSIRPEHRARAVSALNEYGCRYIRIGEA